MPMKQFMIIKALTPLQLPVPYLMWPLTQIMSAIIEPSHIFYMLKTLEIILGLIQRFTTGTKIVEKVVCANAMRTIGITMIQGVPSFPSAFRSSKNKKKSTCAKQINSIVITKNDTQCQDPMQLKICPRTGTITLARTQGIEAKCPASTLVKPQFCYRNLEKLG